MWNACGVCGVWCVWRVIHICVLCHLCVTCVVLCGSAHMTTRGKEGKLSLGRGASRLGPALCLWTPLSVGSLALVASCGHRPVCGRVRRRPPAFVDAQMDAQVAVGTALWKTSCKGSVKLRRGRSEQMGWAGMAHHLGRDGKSTHPPAQRLPKLTPPYPDLQTSCTLPRLPSI